jgi:fructose-1,6-bisphosphatase
VLMALFYLDGVKFKLVGEHVRAQAALLFAHHDYQADERATMPGKNLQASCIHPQIPTVAPGQLQPGRAGEARHARLKGQIRFLVLVHRNISWLPAVSHTFISLTICAAINISVTASRIIFISSCEALMTAPLPGESSLSALQLRLGKETFVRCRIRYKRRPITGRNEVLIMPLLCPIFRSLNHHSQQRAMPAKNRLVALLCFSCCAALSSKCAGDAGTKASGHSVLGSPVLPRSHRLQASSRNVGFISCGTWPMERAMKRLRRSAYAHMHNTEKSVHWGRRRRSCTALTMGRYDMEPPYLPDRRSYTRPSKRTTLLQFLQESPTTDDSASLLVVLQAVEGAVKQISNLCSRNNFNEVRSSMRAKEAGGGSRKSYVDEKTQPLDVMCNDVINDALLRCGHVAVIASEEDDAPIVSGCKPSATAAPWVFVHDPLDGSSNIAAGIPVGTIFGIYPYIPDASAEDNCLQPGEQLRAAGYAIYGASTQLVLSTGESTHIFTLDRSTGEFLLTHMHLATPPQGASYSVNDGRVEDWPAALQAYINDVRGGRGRAQRVYHPRYICRFVCVISATFARQSCSPCLLPVWHTKHPTLTRRLSDESLLTL